MSAHSMSGTVVKTSILAGITGAALAVLVTPKTGNELRNSLRSKGQTLRSKLPHKAQPSSPSGDMAMYLTNEQESMKIKRDERRQTPVLNHWEQEL